jgi:hypothetical protein
MDKNYIQILISSIYIVSTELNGLKQLDESRKVYFLKI